MTITSRSAFFALARTTDPDLAAALVDQLGPSAVFTAPLVPFPPYWVKTKQRGPVAMAAYAAEHCADRVTQEAVWKSTKRKKVRLGLARSQYIDPVLRAQWLNETDQYENYKIHSALTSLYRDHRPEIVVDLAIETLPENAGAGSDLLRQLVSHPEVTADQATRCIYAASGARVFWPAFSVLADRFGGPSFRTNFARTTLSVPEIFKIIRDRFEKPEEFPAAAAKEIINSMLNMSRPNCVSLSDLEEVLAVLAELPPTTSPNMVPRGALEPAPYFSPEAVDLLLASPTWFVVAGRNPLNDTQFASFVSRLDPSSKHHERLALIQATSHARLEALLEVFPTFSNDNVDPDPWLRHAAGASTAVIEAVVTRCDAHVRFMTKGVEVGEQTVYPTTSYLKRLTPDLDLNLRELTWNLHYRAAVSVDYVDQVLWLVPGAARHVIDDPDHRDLANMVYATLVERLGPDMMLGLDLLDNEAATLEKVCRSVQRLHR